MEQFNASLSDLEWNDVLECDDVNLSYKKFSERFSKVFNETCPIVKLNTTRKNHKPWMSSGLNNACKKKNYLYKQFLKYRTEQAEIKYKKYKNKLTSILRSAEQIHYSKKLLQHKGDLKMTWKILNEITQRKKKVNNNSPRFNSEGNIISDGKEISNGCIDFFTNVGPKLANKIKSCPDNNYNKFLSNSITNSIYLNPVTEDEIMKI